MYRIFKVLNVKNRAYVIDQHGNKLYYGTMYQCNKFINHMKGGAADGSGDQGRMDAEGSSMRKSMVSGKGGN